MGVGLLRKQFIFCAKQLDNVLEGRLPKAMERKLKATAKKRGYGKKRAGAFVFGTMRKTGWKPKTQRNRTKKKR